MAAERTFTLKEIETHNKETDCWVIIHGDVLDVSAFVSLHPGGKRFLIEYAGKDATVAFELYHNASVLRKYRDKFKIGRLSGYQEDQKYRPAGSFGDMVAFGDPLWYQRLNSPYYKQTHIDFRDRVRRFVDTEIMPELPSYRGMTSPPQDLYLKMGKEGLLACMVGVPFPVDYVDPGTPCPENFDYFHECILYDELSRCGSSPFVAAVSNGPAIAISAVWRFGSEEQKRRWIPDVLMGRKFCALAVSEPNAGSDVAGLITSARREGSNYVVNGNKKWITNGTYAQLFVTAVVTGSEGGHGSLSVLVIERDTPGLSIRKVKVPGADLSGTAYLDFDGCVVPQANLVGEEGSGWRSIMFNFNHERMYVCCIAIRFARVCLEESIRYALRRKTFGKYLHEHQAIRMKVAAMARRVECIQTWLESVVYNMTTMSHQEASLKLGDLLALIKAEASKVYEYCAHEATMIFGGNALMYGGPGDKIVDAVAQVKGYQIPAGAEDVMDDFGARTIFKLSKMMANL